MNRKKISVITVCYNAVETIEKTILSVINQTYQNVEYIIVDGASSDGTIEIIKKYENQIAKWISEPDMGIYDAMNKGVKMATGDWLFFINSDDLFYNDHVLCRVSLKLLNNNCIYYGDVIMTPSNVIFGGAYNKYKLAMVNICHQSIFYPKTVFEKYLYVTKYILYADWHLNMVCMGDQKFRFIYINDIISFFDTTGFSSSKYDPIFWSDYKRLIKRYLGRDAFVYLYLKKFANKYKSRILQLGRKMIHSHQYF